MIAFYFAFLRHYQSYLYPIALVGTIWTVIQIVEGEIAVPGTGIVVIVGLIWATMMIEHWYVLYFLCSFFCVLFFLFYPLNTKQYEMF